MKTTSDVFERVRRRLGEVDQVLDEMDPSAADRAIELIADAPAIFVTGKGRTGYVAQCFAMRLMQMGFVVHVPGEATCPRIGADDLMFSLSCSGTTATTVEMTRISRKSGARIVAVTANADSPLAQLAHQLILVPVSGEKFPHAESTVLGPYNNTLFEEAMLLYFDALVYSLLERENIPRGRLSERHTNLE